MLTEDNKQKFLKACYKAGVEWADFAHKADSKLDLEDGLNEEFWNTKEADDYVILYGVGRDFDIDIFNAVHPLRTEAARSLYNGCMDRWGQIFGKGKAKLVSVQPMHQPVIGPEPVIKKPVEVAPVVSQPVVTTAVSPNRVFYSGTKIVLNRK